MTRDLCIGSASTMRPSLKNKQCENIFLSNAEQNPEQYAFV